MFLTCGGQRQAGVRYVGFGGVRRPNGVERVGQCLFGSVEHADVVARCIGVTAPEKSQGRWGSPGSAGSC